MNNQEKKPSHKRLMVKEITLKENDVYGCDGFNIYQRVYNGIEEPKNSDNYVLKECWILCTPPEFLKYMPLIKCSLKEKFKEFGVLK